MGKGKILLAGQWGTVSGVVSILGKYQESWK